jgi:hypothetical protein
MRARNQLLTLAFPMLAAGAGLSVVARSWTELTSAIPISGAATITLASDFACDYGSEIDIPRGTNVSILGMGVVLDAVKKGRFFNVNGGALALDSLTLMNGKADDGAAIFNTGDLTVNNANFINGYARAGGAVYSEGALVIKYANFTSSKAYAGGGGAIYIGPVGTCTVDGTTFLSNSAVGYSLAYGGAICNQGLLNAKNAIFENNEATDGGAIYIYAGATCNFDNASFLMNAASRSGWGGGAIYNHGDLTVNCSSFARNVAGAAWAGEGRGGAIANYLGNATLLGSTTFTNNTAGLVGNDIHKDSGTVTFIACGLQAAMTDCCTLPGPTCYSCNSSHSSTGECAPDRAGSQSPGECISTCK